MQKHIVRLWMSSACGGTSDRDEKSVGLSEMPLLESYGCEPFVGGRQKIGVILWLY